MSNSTSLLTQLTTAQAQKEVTANGLFDAHSPSSFGGRRTEGCSGLVWAYYGGSLVVDGTPTAIANDAVTLTASLSNYFERTRAGVFSANTTAFTAGRVPLYTIVTNASTVTSYTDHREAQVSHGVIGRLSLSVAGSSHVTLTAAQARNGVLNFTGILTGSINVIVPDGPHEWTVSNNTTGAYTLTVKTTAGTGVAISQGSSALVFADGTNVVGMSVVGGGTVTNVSVTTANGVSGSVATATTTPAITLTLGAITPTTIVASSTIAGSNLSGTNTGDQSLAAYALTANPLSQFAATTSAQLAGVISDETGTGVLVLATSPTLVTPALGTPSALVLTNATGLPVAGGGTGVATLTAYAPVFGGTTGTGAVQSGTAGTSGHVLTSNGAGVLPTFQAAAGGSTQGRHAVYISAGSMNPSVTGGCALLAGVASAANQPDIRSLDFDTTTEEYAQFNVRMPKSWDEGTVTFAPVWSHAATTTNFGVVWSLQAVATSDADTIAVAYGTAVTSTDTGGTTNMQYAGPESAAITVAGTPAAEDVVRFRLFRTPANGSDTMAIDARLEGITLYITTNADTDA